MTVVELIVAMGIVTVLAGVVVPAAVKAQKIRQRTVCAAQLRQIGVAIQNFRVENRGRLPSRPAGLDQTNPHVFKYKDLPESIGPVMQRAANSRDIFYCPGNFQERTAAQWWPYPSGTIAVTYQFPFLLKSSMWQTKVDDYRGAAASEAVLAADYLGSDVSPSEPLAFNHGRKAADGTPCGMNVLLGGGQVEWRSGRNGFTLWGRSGGPMNWYIARP